MNHCQHKDYWTFIFRSGARHMWCWRCGAFESDNGWINPVGPKGKNPKEIAQGFKYVKISNPNILKRKEAKQE